MTTRQPNKADETFADTNLTTADLSVFKDEPNNKSRIASLPAELLFEIAGRLKTRSLRDLSLVSKRLAAIAQAELCRYPFITANVWGRSRIALLARTLQDRPNLANKVRCLYIRPSSLLVNMKAEAFFKYFFLPPSSCDEGIPETKFVGDILSLVNLEFLDIHITRDVEWLEKRNSENLIDCFPVHLFGEGKTCYGPDRQLDLSLIPGLANVECLELSGSSVDWAWCCLPKLRRLHIGVGCRLLEPIESSLASRLTRLSIVRGADLLLSGATPDSEFERFLASLQNLASLEIRLCNMSIEEGEVEDTLFQGHLSNWDVGGFDNLINMLSPVAPKLERLSIQECYHTDGYKHISFLDFVLPITTPLSQFKRLDVLEVPCEALAGIGQRPLVNVIPKSIRCLAIHAPSLAIIPLLEHIPLDYPGCIQVVELRTSDSRGASHEEWRYRCRALWDHLWDAHIDSEVICEFGYYREEWSDEEYDPFVCEVVDYLERLR